MLEFYPALRIACVAAAGLLLAAGGSAAAAHGGGGAGHTGITASGPTPCPPPRVRSLSPCRPRTRQRPRKA